MGDQATWLFPTLALAIAFLVGPSSAADVAATQRLNDAIPLAAWLDPPSEMRPVARWWWPGGSVDLEGLRDQLSHIEAAGFGAVEIQALLLGLGDADIAADPLLRTAGQPSFQRMTAQASAIAAKLGLAFDVTLGSGWPGGLPTGKRNAERQLLMASVDLRGPGTFQGPLPKPPGQSYRRAVEWILDVLGPVDRDVRVVAVIAARPGPDRNGVPTLEDVRVISQGARSTPLSWQVPDGAWRLFVFYENSTGHFVMGGAYPGQEADARVVDHLSQRGADALLSGYAAPLFAAMPKGSVRELFVDSFELMGELPTTAALLNEFEARTGYALTPHLPLVFIKGGESKYGEMIDFLGREGGPLYLAEQPGQAARIREDYERVRAALFQERFIERIRSWAHAHGATLRIQAHGGYADYLDVYAMADVPESEALFAAGSFDFLKLASSAAHVAGRRWASSESFITLRFFGRRLGRDEMRLLAGRAFSAGINRLAYHGVPQPYTRADGEPWYPFSGGFGRILAGPLPMSSEIDRTFLAQLTSFNTFVARLTVAMSQGQPVADVAWLRAEPTFPDTASFVWGRIEARAGESATTRALRARGLVHDRVSRRMLSGARVEDGVCRIGAGRYRAILLDPLEIAEPEMVEALATVAEAGVPVVALGTLPRRAAGLRNAEARDKRVDAAVKRLLKHVIRVTDPNPLQGILQASVPSSLVEPVPPASLAVSLERRRTRSAETLFVFNESWSPLRERLRFTRAGGALTRWDPRTGERLVLRPEVKAGDVIEIGLGPAQSLILTLAVHANVGG